MDKLEERLLEEITGWEQAYPLSAFPEPDLARAAAVLKAEGMTLDAISASNMRHVVSRLAPSIHEAADALAAKQALIDELVETLRPFAKAADSYRGNQDEFEIVLPRGPFFGKDDWPPHFTVGQLRRARALIARSALTRSSGKAGSDA